MSTEKKADFSDVTAKVDSTAEQVKKADFSDVSATVDSTAEIIGERTYTIEKGDTLSKIAKEQLGHASAWKQIFEANRDVLDDPDRIFPGQVIKLPPADTDTTA
jgi:nucleoid-associated protein YgaU